MYYAGPPDEVDDYYLIKQKDVDSYFSYDNYITAFSIWHKFSLGMGFPFTGGWAEQPFWITEVIALFENAKNLEDHVKYSNDKPNQQSKDLSKPDVSKLQSFNS